MTEILGMATRVEAFAPGTPGCLLLVIEGDYEGVVMGCRIVHDTYADVTSPPSLLNPRFRVLLRTVSSGAAKSSLMRYRAVAVFRQGPPLPEFVQIDHEGGTIRVPILPLPPGTYAGLDRLMEATNEAARDGVIEGLGFSASLDLSEAIRTALDELSRTVSASDRTLSLSSPPIASLAESGILAPLSDSPLLYARLRLPPSLGDD